MSALKFATQFIVEPASIGAFAPSSQALAEMVTDSALVKDAQYVVEFGPGTGAITKTIEKKLQDGAGFMAMEINPAFAEIMRQTHPDLLIVEDGAQNVCKYLEEQGIASCDAIISGIPFASLPEELQDDVLAASYEALRPGGKFVTFTYLMSPYLPKGRIFRQKMEKTFKETGRTRIVWGNLPPAFAYYGVK